MNQITVIGSINMDISICSDTFPQIGETINGYDFSTQPGGKGSNQAITVGKLAGKVSFLGCIGDDNNGEILRQTLNEYHVNADHLEKVPNQTSGTAMIFVCNGDNSIIVNSGANCCVNPEYATRYSAVIAESRILLSQLEIPLDTVIAAFRIAKEHSVTTILNPAPIMQLPEELFQLTDIIILNETEAEYLTKCSISGIEDAKAAICALTDMGFQTSIITLGSLGCVFTSDDGSIEHLPARKVNAIDTTGAGDSFCGAFAYALANNFSIKDAIQLATLVSSVTVTRRGAALSTPTRDEINTLLRKEGIPYELP